MRLPDPALDPGYYADILPKRFLAWVVDVVLTLLALLVVLALTLLMAAAILPLVWMALAIGYRYVFLTRYDATPGMMLAGLRLRRLDGTRAEPGHILAHAAIYSLAMATIIGQIASVAILMTTPYRQALNDLVLGTTMVHRDPDHD
jgi:uncharacterized RDD family membrane protein YckC